MAFAVEGSVRMATTETRLSDGDLALFKGKNFGHFATVMPDGAPQVTPVWVDVEDATGLIVVNTALGRVKTENVERDRRVAISVHDQEDPYTMVAIRGRVVEITRTGAEDHIDFLSNKYHGQDYTEHGDRVLLKIALEHVARM
jgi:PPOX class probable F420-dependent enzyme